MEGAARSPGVEAAAASSRTYAHDSTVADVAEPEPSLAFETGLAALYDSEGSYARIRGYYQHQYSSRRIYEAECQRLQRNPHPQLLHMLPAGPAVFDLGSLEAPAIGLQCVLPLLDLIRVNTQLTALCLRSNFLSGESLVVLADVLAAHPSIMKLDISNNAAVFKDRETVGQALLSLIQLNAGLVELRTNGLHLPTYLKQAIARQLDANWKQSQLVTQELVAKRKLLQAMELDRVVTPDRGDRARSHSPTSPGRRCRATSNPRPKSKGVTSPPLRPPTSPGRTHRPVSSTRGTGASTSPAPRERPSSARDTRHPPSPGRRAGDRIAKPKLRMGRPMSAGCMRPPPPGRDRGQGSPPPTMPVMPSVPSNGRASMLPSAPSLPQASSAKQLSGRSAGGEHTGQRRRSLSASNRIL
uniref:Uncharacterized protein n=1 Tax=Eutreptiella gymnastica TaxID=73025 RepID=A0A7S4CWZ7_9EUGL